MAKTIKQLADELHVSKTWIRNFMDENFRARYTEKGPDGAIQISDDGCKLLCDGLRKPPESDANLFAETAENGANQFAETAETTEKSTSSVTDALVGMLQRELDAKNDQIEQLNKSLLQAQALHAGAMQQQQQLAAPMAELEQDLQEARAALEEAEREASIANDVAEAAGQEAQRAAEKAAEAEAGRKSLEEENEALKAKIEALEGRGFWARLFNRT